MDPKPIDAPAAEKITPPESQPSHPLKTQVSMGVYGGGNFETEMRSGHVGAQPAVAFTRENWKNWHAVLGLAFRFRTPFSAKPGYSPVYTLNAWDEARLPFKIEVPEGNQQLFTQELVHFDFVAGGSLLLGAKKTFFKGSVSLMPYFSVGLGCYTFDRAYRSDSVAAEKFTQPVFENGDVHKTWYSNDLQNLKKSLYPTVELGAQFEGYLTPSLGFLAAFGVEIIGHKFPVPEIDVPATAFLRLGLVLPVGPQRR